MRAACAKDHDCLWTTGRLWACGYWLLASGGVVGSSNGDERNEMLHRDYLVDIFLRFAETIRRSWKRAQEEDDPKAAADALEDMVGEATDMDGVVLLSLAPESIAGIMQVSGVDPRVTEYLARSLLLASAYWEEADEQELANVRRQQAYAIADAYGFALPERPDDAQALLSDLEIELSRQA